MLLLHVDQRPARTRCLEQLARLPSEDPWFERGVYQEIQEILRACELAPNVFAGTAIHTLKARMKLGHRDACERLVARVIRKRGRIRPWGVALVLAVLAAVVVALGSLWSPLPAAALGAVASFAVLVALPVGGLVARTLVVAAVRGPTRRMLWRWEMFQTLAPGSDYARKLYERMIADVDRGRADAELAGAFFGAAMSRLAKRAAASGEAELLRRMFEDTRALILSDRVPWLSGDGLADVLVAAGKAGAGVSPVVAGHLIRKLRGQAPDVSLFKLDELSAAERTHRSYLASSRASRWERYAEAREVAFVAPRARVDADVTRSLPSRERTTARSRYLAMLRAFVTRALADESEGDVKRLLGDIEAYLEHRQRWTTPAPNADRALDEILETLADNPEAAAAAQDARRVLESTCGEHAGDGDDEGTRGVERRGETFAEELERRAELFGYTRDQPPSRAFTRHRQPLGPGGPLGGERDGFSGSWDSWYRSHVRFAIRVLDGGWTQRAFDNRTLLHEHLGEKPRVDYLVEHYPGAFADAVANDWQRVHDALLGPRREVTPEDLAYRTLDGGSVAQVKVAAAAARRQFLREHADEIVEPFPIDEDDLETVAGRMVVLPEIGPRDRIRWASRRYLVAGDGGRVCYVADPHSETMTRVLRARDRYAERVSPTIGEELALIGRVRPEPMPWVVDGRAVRALRVEVLAATVGEAMFVDTRAEEDGESPFAGEDALPDRGGTVAVAPDASPRQVMEAAIHALKVGDRDTWASLFARWRLILDRSGGKSFEPRYYDGAPTRRWTPARRRLFDDVCAVNVVDVGQVRCVLTGDEIDGAPAIDEVDVEVEHVGNFPGGYRPFTDSSVNRVWTLQRKDGGPWRIVTRAAI